LPLSSRTQPSGGAARVEAGAVGDQHSPAWSQNPNHLGDRLCNLGNIDQRQVTDNQVAGSVGEGAGFGPSHPVVMVGMLLPRVPDAILGRIDANRRDAEPAEHAAEQSFTAACIESRAELLTLDARDHGGIDDILAGVVTTIRHIGDPRRSRFRPSFSYGARIP
jgi:hypothetical protein